MPGNGSEKRPGGAPSGQGNGSGNGNPPGTPHAACPTCGIVPRQRERRLRKLSHVKGALAWVARQCEAGTIDPSRANAMTNALRELGNVMGYDVAAEILKMRKEIDSAMEEGIEGDADNA